MSESVLDRLDRDPGGARRWLAQAFVVAGASRAQVARQLRAKYGVTVTPRTLTNWRAKDSTLVELMVELEQVKRDLAPDDPTNPADLLRDAPDAAQNASDLFGLTIQFPPLAKLVHREAKRRETDPGLAFAQTPAADPDPDDAVHAVLAAAHPTAAEFAADCERRLGDYDPHAPALAA